MLIYYTIYSFLYILSDLSLFYLTSGTSHPGVYMGMVRGAGNTPMIPQKQKRPYRGIRSPYLPRICTDAVEGHYSFLRPLHCSSMERVSRIDFNPHRHINIPFSGFRAKSEQIYAGDAQEQKYRPPAIKSQTV